MRAYMHACMCLGKLRRDAGNVCMHAFRWVSARAHAGMRECKHRCSKIWNARPACMDECRAAGNVCMHVFRTQGNSCSLERCDCVHAFMHVETHACWNSCMLECCECVHVFMHVRIHACWNSVRGCTVHAGMHEFKHGRSGSLKRKPCRHACISVELRAVHACMCSVRVCPHSWWRRCQPCAHRWLQRREPI